MIPIYNQLDVHYTIDQELALAGDIVAQPNTEYTANSGYVLNLPDVIETEIGSVVVLKQVSGTSTVEDHTSRRDLYDEDEELDTLVVESGETVGFYLHYTYGRRQWVQLSPLLFASGGGGGGTGAILEVFTVADIASRDALPIGGSVGQVSEGDVAVVLDSDGEGTKQNYTYFTDTGWMLSTELTGTYTEQFFAADIAARNALPTGVGVNKVSIGDNVTVADGDGAGTKKIFQWGGDTEGYILIYSEDLANPEETFSVADIAARDALTIGSGDGEVSDGDTVRVNDYDGYGNAALYTYYDGSGYVLSSTYGHEALLRLGQESKELSGFIDNDNIVSSYNPTTRRVTLTHTSGVIKYIWQNSVRELTSPWVSDPHPDSAGNWFLMMNDGETPEWLSTPWAFSALMMAFVTYDAVPGIRMGVIETHGIMPYELHRTNHINVGTWKEQGTGELTPGTYTLGVGNDNVAITPGVEEAFVNDEDIRASLAALSEGNYTVHYLSGAGNTNILLDQPVPFRSSGTFMYANLLVNGVYTDVALSNGDFVNVYCIFVPAMADADSQKYRYIFQVGQQIHTALDSALAEQPYNLNIGDMSLLSNEFTIGFKLTYQARNANSTTGKVQLDQVTYIEGTRANLVSSVSTTELTQSLLDIGDATLDPTGFIDNGNIDVSYDAVARTVTLTHPSGLIAYVWRNRIRQLISPWTSDPHVDAPGQYFLKSQDGQTFVWDDTDLHEPYTDLHIAYVNYQQPSVSDSGCIREVHGFMQHTVHHELHHLLGTWKEGGTGKLTDATYQIAPAVPADADITPGVDQVIVHDEDSPTIVPALVEGSYTVHYLGAGGVSTFVKSNAFPFRVDTNVMVANIGDTNGDYSDVQVPNGKFVNVYCYAMPMASDAGSQTYRFIWQVGQQIHDALDLALLESPQDLEYGAVAAWATEAVMLFKLTFKKHSSYVTTGGVRIENVQYFEGAEGALIAQSSNVLPSHKHSSIDILGLPATNTGAVTVPHGYVVGLDGSGNYRLYTDSTYTFVGVNTNNDAPVDEVMHVKSYGLMDAVVINAATLSHGDPLRIDLTTGRLTLYTPGEQVTPVVATFIKNIDGTLAMVRAITPTWPRRYVWQLTSMGVITPGSTNILEDDYEGGKLIFVGNPSYLLRTRAKYKVPSATQADFGTYRNSDVDPIFSDAMTPSASPDTFGNWQDTLTGLVATSLFSTGDEIRLTDDSVGSIDGEDLAIQFEFEERVLWNIRT